MLTHSLRALLLGSALLTAPAFAHEGERHAGAVGDTSGDQDDRPSATPILVEGLGDYGFGLENASLEVRAWFDQGLGHLWGFNHAEAARAFRMAQSLDPSCALCLWGEAYALGPNLNDIMHPEAGG